jgi:hypothetical protein
MNNPDHISQPFFWVTICKFFDAVPGYGMEKSWIRIWDKHPGSATLLAAIVVISHVNENFSDTEVKYGILHRNGSKNV